MRFVLAAALFIIPSSAWAEHDHAAAHAHHAAFGAGVTMLAGSYDTKFFVGNYQGVQPGVSWANHRFAVGASGALYRIERNGASYYGLGDLVVHGQARLAGTERLHGGVVLAVSAPVGDEQHGLGMGHPMVMPAAFGSLSLAKLVVTATAGYGRALGDSSDHDHGMWPIVDPMNTEELTWSTAATYAFRPALHGGARVSGGVPIGDGDTRAAGALRVGWLAGRFTTAAELQAGLAGNPFNVRGVVSTMVSF